MRKRMPSRRSRGGARSLVGADGALPKSQQLVPLEFVSKMILTIKSAPRQRVVDLAFDSVCRLHGYMPMKVLTFLRDQGLVFVDDSHAHKVIGLTEAGRKVGENRRLDS